jgi:hypothetical protein
MIVEGNVLTAEDGKVLTNGSTYSKQVWLGINDSVNNWWEMDEGTKDAPIPFTTSMEIFKDKYYTQDGVLYLCIRDSGIALSHNLQDLINIYVSRV